MTPWEHAFDRERDTRSDSKGRAPSRDRPALTARCGSAGSVSRCSPAPIEATAALDGLADLADVDVRALDDDTCLGLFDAPEVADRLFPLHAVRAARRAPRPGLTDTRPVTSFRTRRPGGTAPTSRRPPRRHHQDGLRRLPDVADALRAGTVSVDRTRGSAGHLNDRTVDTFSMIRTSSWPDAFPCNRRTFARRRPDRVLADHDGSEPPRPCNRGRHPLRNTLSATIDLYRTRQHRVRTTRQCRSGPTHRQAVSDHDLDPSLDAPLAPGATGPGLHRPRHRGATATSSRSGSTGPTADVTITVDLDEHTTSVSCSTTGRSCPDPLPRARSTGRAGSPIPPRPTPLVGPRVGALT